MLILITGGSGSGKSSYAESYIMKLSENVKRYYIATMQVYGEEGRRKVERHREMRAGKGFFTIEQPMDIELMAEKLHPSEIGKTVALLECMSNLAANEMFSEEQPKSCNFVTDKIINGIEQLGKSFHHMVIVSNNVFEDGIVYDDTTMEYIRAMGQINQKLARMADKVIEVVVGIPVVVKEGK